MMEKERNKASGVPILTPRMRLFLFVFLLTFLITFAILSVFGIVPESSSTDAKGVADASERRLDENPQVETYAVPVRIRADSIGLDAKVLNPESRNVAALDSALLSGVVRYPDSGKLSDNVNMLLFGHSTSLPVVHNGSFKLFNGIKNLERGDIVRVYSEKREYLYRVDSVSHVDASEALITFSKGEKKLTLSTCDSFGKKTDRYVVEASFVGSYPVEN